MKCYVLLATVTMNVRFLYTTSTSENPASFSHDSCTDNFSFRSRVSRRFRISACCASVIGPLWRKSFQ